MKQYRITRKRTSPRAPHSFLSLIAFTAIACLAANSAPVLDYSVALRGFAAEGYSEGNHLELGLSLASEYPASMLPRIFMRYLAPADFRAFFSKGAAEIGIDTALVKIDKHPFAFLSHRPLSWIPTASFAVSSRLSEPADFSLAIGISPLTFFAGYGTFSGPGGGLLFSMLSGDYFGYAGWYLDILRFTYPLAGRSRR